MSNLKDISATITNIGVKDFDIRLFEGQYPVEHGMAYNSYVINDAKIAILDTVDKAVTEEWFNNLDNVLGDKKPDYLIVSHLEPDHSSNIENFINKYPDVTIVASQKALLMLPQFFDIPEGIKQISVKDGDSLVLGQHELHFVMAPMVHWPEVMMTYESSEKVLFAADAFGSFGCSDGTENWKDEARRYYINIVGKYGIPVQNVLKKASALDIKTICSLHGPILKDNLSYYIDLYSTWSSYSPETDGVLVVYASIYGNTKCAAEKLQQILKNENIEVALCDLAKQDVSEAVSLAFKYSKSIFMAPSYDGGVFPLMETFLNHLQSKTFQNRKVALVENASWAPTAVRTMRTQIEQMKNISICSKCVTIKTRLSEESINELIEMVHELIE